jgi:cyclopropane-fatty-acyl-phospholipid synthase
MAMFALEHSRKAYVIDFAVIVGANLVLLALLLANNPVHRWWSLIGYVFSGALLWTPLEYVLHRFVLHGLAPFKMWHQLHHERPFALIYTPTQFIVIAFLVLVYMPLWALTSMWVAVALTLGLTSGYLLYSTAHHALHHWVPWNAWFMREKVRHARHHVSTNHVVAFGVTTSIWDKVFGTENE